MFAFFWKQKETLIGPVRIRHSSHDFGWQSSHSVDLSGCQAKMASIEIWIPWRNAHKPHCNILRCYWLAELHLKKLSCWNDPPPRPHFSSTIFTFILVLLQTPLTTCSVQVVVNGALDFEQSTFQNIVVVVTDQGGLSFSKSFNISIIDKNDPPTVSEWLIETIEQTRLQLFHMSRR